METNSEKKLTWISVAMTVVTMLAAALGALLDADLIPKEHIAYVIIAGVLAVAGSVGVYTAGRSKKKAAEALGAKAAPLPPQ